MKCPSESPKRLIKAISVGSRFSQSNIACSFATISRCLHLSFSKARRCPSRPRGLVYRTARQRVLRTRGHRQLVSSTTAACGVRAILELQGNEQEDQRRSGMNRVDQNPHSSTMTRYGSNSAMSTIGRSPSLTAWQYLCTRVLAVRVGHVSANSTFDSVPNCAHG